MKSYVRIKIANFLQKSRQTREDCMNLILDLHTELKVHNVSTNDIIRLTTEIVEEDISKLSKLLKTTQEVYTKK